MARVWQGTSDPANHPKPVLTERGLFVLFTIPAALLFGTVLAFMLRFRAVTFSGALIAALFGFYLAATGLAPAVNHAVLALFHALIHLH